MCRVFARVFMLVCVTIGFGMKAEYAYSAPVVLNFNMGTLAPVGTQLLGGPPIPYSPYSGWFAIYDSAPGNTFFNNGSQGILVQGNSIHPYVSQSYQNQQLFNLTFPDGGYSFIYNISFVSSSAGVLSTTGFQTNAAPLANSLSSVNLYKGTQLIETGSIYDVLYNGSPSYVYVDLAPINVVANGSYTLSVTGATGPEGFSELTGIFSIGSNASLAAPNPIPGSGLLSLSTLVLVGVIAKRRSVRAA